MNTLEPTETQKSQSEFLTEEELKAFEEWKARKIYNGSKPYETNGVDLESSSNSSCI